MCFVPYEGNSGRFISVPYASCTSVIPDEGLGSIYRVFFLLVRPNDYQVPDP